MDLLPLRAAAGAGTLDDIPAAQLVAAGFTLLQRSPALVRALAGRRAAILLPTSPAFLAALAAADGRGAVLVNPLAARAEVAHQLVEADVGAVLTIRSLADRLPAGTLHALLDELPGHATVVAADGTTARVDLGSHFGLELSGDAETPGRDEECAIVYTSAMAGTPRGAILTHRNLLANARQVVEAAAYTRDDRVLAVLPFSHLFGLTVPGVAPLLAGATVRTMPRFNPLTAVDRIEREGITAVVGVPAIFLALLAAIERRGGRLDAPALRLCLCGGAVLDPAVQERWESATGVALRQGYGLTEASPVALFNHIDAPNRVGALGTAMPGVRVSIRDPGTSAELPAGTEGEICVAGETVFRGYVGGATDGLAVRDGWLHTGDLGIADDAGVIRFRGLRKPMFTRNGFNIYPAELERAFAELPGVRRARVTPTEDASSEHGIHLALEGEVTEAEVAAWAEARLAAYKRPTAMTLRRR